MYYFSCEWHTRRPTEIIEGKEEDAYIGQDTNSAAVTYNGSVKGQLAYRSFRLVEINIDIFGGGEGD